MPIMKIPGEQWGAVLKAIRRILYYTHNSIGIGHVFRARAVITGIRRWRPDLDFLVISGTSVPHILLREGIEVVKLPSVEKVFSGRESTVDAVLEQARQDAQRYKPRHLRNMPLAEIMDLRRKIIRESFRWFDPDVVMVEHYIGGLLDEMLPVLTHGRSNRSNGGTIRAALSRGIVGSNSKIFTACGRHHAETIFQYYDRFYCFDAEPALDQDIPPENPKMAMAAKIAYLGKITDKCREELPDRSRVCDRLRLTEKPIILLSLSRHGPIAGLCIRFLETLCRMALNEHYQVIFVIDPYLDKGVLETIQQNPLAAQVRFLPFFYPLIDIINVAELVICRAGYNTINELLLTGVKALVIPEAHPSGEQELRSMSLPRENIVVLREDEALRAPLDSVVRDLLERKSVPLGYDFNKYSIGKRIITDLEACFSAPGDSFGRPSPRSPGRAPGTAGPSYSC